MKLKFNLAGKEGLDLIQPLWEKLNDHHKNQTSDFKEHYKNFTFQERKEVLLNKALEGDMYICLAEDEESGTLLGYIVTTISQGNEGEIDSIYVEEEYRLMGIGDALMQRSIKWMDEKNIKTKKVAVATYNQAAISFYERYGFRRRSVTLEQVFDHL
jgi:ribosomal protein S18 acetylase RimI-like enzyme